MREGFAYPPEELVNPAPVFGGDPAKRRARGAEGRAPRQVALIGAENPCLPRRADLIEDPLDDRDMFFVFAIAGIEHDHNKARQPDLLKGRSKRLDQEMRELADKAHRVGDKEFSALRGVCLAHGRIEGGEEAVTGGEGASREAVHQARFAGVGIAAEGNEGDIAEALLALLSPAYPDQGEAFLQGADSFLDTPPVELDLRLSGAAEAGAALAPGKVGVAALETGEGVFEAREFNLLPGYRGARVPREELEYQLAPVQDRAGKRVFEYFFLRRRDVMPEDHQGAIACLHYFGKLGELSLAREELLPASAPLERKMRYNAKPAALRKPGELRIALLFRRFALLVRGASRSPQLLPLRVFDGDNSVLGHTVVYCSAVCWC